MKDNEEETGESQRLTVEVFDKPAVKILSFTILLSPPAQHNYHGLLYLDLATVREKLISHGTVVCVCVCVFLAVSAFLWACTSCLQESFIIQ